MATDKPRCSCCADWYHEGIERVREARANAGWGPEELPHRKVGKKKGRPKKDDHKHIYVKEIRKNTWSYYTYWAIVWQCAEFNCEKIKKVRYVYNEKALDGYRDLC
jgi:hypothetical protein